jgi:hypothetical protein
MKNRILLLIALLLPALLATAQPRREFDQGHGRLNKVLSTYVKQDRVDYPGLKRNRKGLDLYIAELEQITLPTFQRWTREQRFAYWINAYNAYTLRLIVNNYPLQSILEIKEGELDAWHQRFIPLQHLFPKLSKAKLTLNDIENEILRPTYKDARLHAAVNCAAISCPPLRNEAFTAKRLNEQLNRSTLEWLKDESRNRFDALECKVKLSKIFEWYAEDFKIEGAGPATWLAKHAPKQHRSWLADCTLKVEFLPYDWNLNDAPQK